ncbi:bax inhibitor family protein [Pseudohyphozyma bogoriensis]|nr:bax inhibitor family protein [Pseudohyphozyma bogoriensis]
MTSYPVPPPSYQAPTGKPAYGATAAEEQPLFASGAGPSNEWSGVPGEEDDIEGDFKIGVTVSQSSQEVRNAFIRKVYSILFCQILLSAVVGGVMMTESVSGWVREHSGLMLIPMFGAIGVMIATYVKRHSHPSNILLLGLFTLLEAITVGSVLSYYNSTIVLQAFVITTFVFIGLTLFTFQSKYDFDGMAPYLFGALLVFFLTGLVGLFIPYSNTVDIVMAGAGTLLFSAYIVFDTHLLLKRLSVEDWVLACISLYLDILNLFLQILRLLSDIQDR